MKTSEQTKMKTTHKIGERLLVYGFVCEVIALHPDGDYEVQQVDGKVLMDELKALAEMRGTIGRIQTQLRIANEQYQEHGRTLDHWALMIGHECRTALNGNPTHATA